MQNTGKTPTVTGKRTEKTRKNTPDGEKKNRKSPKKQPARQQKPQILHFLLCRMPTPGRKRRKMKPRIAGAAS